jgi:DNA-binding transcriptional MocR family regulator
MKSVHATPAPHPPAAAPVQPIYLRLADQLEAMIRRGTFRPGDRMPSVRRLGREQRVSVPTAMHAYSTLETRGHVEARPKSGFYVCARLADSIPEPLNSDPPSRVSDLAHTDPLSLLRCDDYDPTRIPFGSAVPSPDLLPGIRLGRTISRVARRLGVNGGNYGPIEGPFALRREISRRLVSAGVSLGPENLCITLGATEAISLALQAVCSPGDTVVVETPTFFGLLRQLRELGLNALPIPVHASEGIDLDALATALARTPVKALLLVPNFHNPLGFAMSDRNKRELVRIAASRNLPVIEDDLYADMAHQGPRPHALKAFDTAQVVIHCSSYSKNVAPGYRVGYIAAGRWQERVLALKRVHSSANPLLPALAVAEFLRDGGYDRFMRSFRESCRQQVLTMRDAIRRAFPEDIRMSRPAGGYVLWCELPRCVDSMALFYRALEAGIAIAPGPFFSPEGGFPNFIRINCGYPWSSRIERGVQTLGQLVREQCSGSRPAASRRATPGARRNLVTSR